MPDYLKVAIEEGLLNESIQQLKLKHAIVNKVLKEAADEGLDYTEAERQARVLNAALVEKIKQYRRENGIPEPPDVRVQMKSGPAVDLVSALIKTTNPGG